jgi:hypothetical protein
MLCEWDIPRLPEPLLTANIDEPLLFEKLNIYGAIYEGGGIHNWGTIYIGEAMHVRGGIHIWRVKMK